MLTARGDKRIGRARLRWALAFTPRMWCMGVHREGLVLDTRFVPAALEARRRTRCLYLLVDGAFVIHGEAGLRFEAPSAFVLSHEHLEGAGGARPFTFTASGHPYTAIELHFSDADVIPEPAERPVPVTLDAAAWELARVVGRLDGDDDTHRRHVAALLARVASLGIVAPSAAAADGPPRAFEVLWAALRPMIERLYLTPTLQEVGDATGVSLRQVDRYIQEFVTAFALVGEGWRPTTRHLRLKLAILLLSAEGATVAEVAGAIGYGSSDAMARAFRDAGLLPPNVVQAQLRASTLAR